MSKERGSPVKQQPRMKSRKSFIPTEAEAVNDSRAEWATRVIGFIDRNREDEFQYPATKTEIRLNQEGKIADLIADLAHYCDREGFSLKKALELASSRYLNSTGNEGKQL